MTSLAVLSARPRSAALFSRCVAAPAAPAHGAAAFRDNRSSKFPDDEKFIYSVSELRKKIKKKLTHYGLITNDVTLLGVEGKCDKPIRNTQEG